MNMPEKIYADDIRQWHETHQEMNPPTIEYIRADLVPAVDLGMVLEALRDLRSAAMSSSYPHEAIKQAEQAISHLEAAGVKNG